MAPTLQNLAQPFHSSSVKELVASYTISSHYAFFKNPNDAQALPGDDIPIIDFSLITSDDLIQRLKCVDDLGKACKDWGFFLVKNHGIPEFVHDAMVEACYEFIAMPENEKQEFKTKKDAMEPIKFGTSNNLIWGEVGFWRDYMKLFLHRNFNAPSKPAGFREALMECSTRKREVMKELLKGVSKG